MNKINNAHLICVWPCLINVGKVIYINQLHATITIYWSTRSAQHVSGNLLPIFTSVRLRFLQHMVSCLVVVVGRGSESGNVSRCRSPNPCYSLSEAETTSGHMVLSGVPRKKSPVTTPGIDPGTVRLVAPCLNQYATPGPFSSFSINWNKDCGLNAGYFQEEGPSNRDTAGSKYL